MTKKLEWKAAPKVGSLDHSFKKHGKGSKGESKEGKLLDGQVSNFHKSGFKNDFKDLFTK